jgi:hypothetical protein
MALNLPILDPHERCAKPRPARGEQRLEVGGKKRERKLAEEKTMAAAVRRDGGKCRWPRCEYKALKVAAAHMDHRKMGGNPSGDKTQLHKLITLCIRHHDQFDGRTIPSIAIEPISAQQGTSGPCAYYVQDETGKWQHVATERVIGVSSTRGR